jgi:hypothetical protein
MKNKAMKKEVPWFLGLWAGHVHTTQRAYVYAVSFSN